jgi:hypothetical protein
MEDDLNFYFFKMEDNLKKNYLYDLILLLLKN